MGRPFLTEELRLGTESSYSVLTASTLILRSGSSDDNQIVRWNGTGTSVQGSVPTIDDLGNFSTSGEYTVFEGTAKEFELGEEVLQTLSTGAYSFGGLAVNVDNVSVDVGAGSGHIVNYHDDPQNPTYQDISWSAQNVSITASSTPGAVTYLYADNTGTIQQTLTKLTQAQRRENIFIGRAVTNAAGTALIQAQETIEWVLSPANQIANVLDILGLINIDVAVSAISSTLGISTSGGSILARGTNPSNDAANPHEQTISSASPIPFKYIDQDTGGTGADITAIDPTTYDNAGTPTSISGSNNRATSQRVYVFPSGNWRIAYGQHVYNSLQDAIQNLATETFVDNPSIAGNGILVAVVVLTKGCTDLSDKSTCRILSPGRFGEVAVGGSGISVSSLQQAYENSLDGNITSNATIGPFNLQEGTADDTASLLDILNNAGSTTLSVLANGKIQAADGLISAPSFAFLNDTDTGIYSSGSGNFTIVSGGESRLNIGDSILAQAKDGSGATVTINTGDHSAGSGGNYIVNTGSGSSGTGGDFVFNAGVGSTKDGSVTFNMNQAVVEAGDFTISQAQDINLNALNDIGIEADNTINLSINSTDKLEINASGILAKEIVRFNGGDVDTSERTENRIDIGLRAGNLTPAIVMEDNGHNAVVMNVVDGVLNFWSTGVGLFGMDSETPQVESRTHHEFQDTAEFQAPVTITTSTTEGRECIELDQNDTDQPFIEYSGSSSADDLANITTGSLGTIQGAVRKKVNGTDFWFPYYNFSGGACPFVYVIDSKGDEHLQGEILKNQVGQEWHQIGILQLEKTSSKIRIKEEKDEISFIDWVKLRVVDLNNVVSWIDSGLEKTTMKKGDVIDLDFGTLPGNIYKIELVAKGYYEKVEA